MKGNYIYATGRRKEAVARVYLKPGTGKFTVNGRELSEYVKRSTLKMIVEQPLVSTEMLGKVDIKAYAKGGGLTGQAGALLLGIARALVKSNEEFRPILRRKGFLTRDPRMVERKKYGRAGARKRFQFSKR
ncbi:MAG: 30S ribosomal protein S9 [candidate division KSB1 bacterium]|nr:30S ribosomal protein S9 [candidate division KSB1 bacterium]MDZ7370744.1 30S ribosomal protein S9 [candidate division KSB1 bacterium]